MSKIPEEQTPDKLGSVVNVSCGVPESWRDSKLGWEVRPCLLRVVLVRKGKSTKGEVRGCQGSRAGQVMHEL